MEYKNDGLMQNICCMLRLTGIIIFGAWNERYKQPRFLENGACEDLYQKLLNMIDAGLLNEAENKLISYLEEMEEWQTEIQEEKECRDVEQLKLALSVYGYMNDKEDSFLESHSYSRVEIEEGILSVLQSYHVSVPC